MKTKDVLASVSVLLSLAAMGGWIAHQPYLSRLGQDFVPMQFNAALAIGALGLAWIFTRIDRAPSRIALALSGFTGLVAALTLLQYAMDADFGIDQLFFRSDIAAYVIRPGRMAPLSAASLLALSAAVALLHARRVPDWLASMLSLFLSMLPGLMGLVGLLGYVGGLLGLGATFHTAYGWASFTRMALGTALSLLALGAAGIVCARQKDPEKGGLASALLGSVLLIGSVALWQGFSLSDATRIREAGGVQAHAVHGQILLAIEERVLGLQRMAQLIESRGQKSFTAWNEEASLFVRDYPDLQAIDVTGPDGQIQWIHPPRERRPALGLRLALDPLRSRALDRARAEQSPMITPIVTLKSGGRGFLVAAPFSLNGRFGGFVVGVERSERLLSDLIQLNEYSLVIRQDGLPVFQLNPARHELAAEWGMRTRLMHRTLDWEIEVTPTLERLRKSGTWLPFVVFLTGTLISILVAVALRLALIAQDRELAARSLSSFLSAVVENLPVALVCKDVRNDFRYTLWNRKAAEVWGMEAEKILGRNDFELFPREVAEGLRARDVESVRLGIVQDHPEVTVNSANGTQALVHARIVPIQEKSSPPRYVLEISEDITQRRSVERLLERQREQILHAEKMTAMAEMAGGIAHEINNPLAVIEGGAAQLRVLTQRGLLTAERTVELASLISATIHRIARIIQGLRAFARDAEEDPFVTSSLATILADTLDFCQARFSSHGVALRCATVPPELELECRAVQVSQVLLNLLNNAFDAAVGSASPSVELQVEDRGDGIEISVLDSGPGVPPELADRIMQPFFTTKEVGKGTGLGLSISSSVARSHSGTLFLDSASPRTRFVLRLPKAQSTRKVA